MRKEIKTKGERKRCNQLKDARMEYLQGNPFTVQSHIITAGADFDVRNISMTMTDAMTDRKRSHFPHPHTETEIHIQSTRLYFHSHIFNSEKQLAFVRLKL